MKYILIFFILFGLLSCSKQDVSQSVTTNTGVIMNNENASNNNTSNSTGVLLIDVNIENLRKTIQNGALEDAEKEALLLYETNKESIILLNMLGNIYNKKGEPKNAIKYLEEANKISEGKDGYILFNLGVSYSSIDKEKSKRYLDDAKILLPDDENLDNFLKSNQ